ncbi:hypothetical protein [Acetobacter persici]|uniref:hypothetical protein n=1 Tax=Acetobacter persici TaxID=1076596 RepID=UPI0012FD4156|nr:hypothetical protein [Acetobacter persici]
MIAAIVAAIAIIIASDDERGGAPPVESVGMPEFTVTLCPAGIDLEGGVIGMAGKEPMAGSPSSSSSSSSE